MSPEGLWTLLLGKQFDELREKIEDLDSVPVGAAPWVANLHRETLKRITLLDQRFALDRESDRSEAWIALERASPAQAVYERNLAEQLAEIGCTADGALYVILGLIDRLHGLDGPDGATLAGKLLDGAHCAGAQELPDNTKAKLKAIRGAGVQDSATGIRHLAIKTRINALPSMARHLAKRREERKVRNGVVIPSDLLVFERD